MHVFITSYGVGESRVKELQQLALSGMGIKRAREPHLDPPKEGPRFSPAEIEAAVWQHSFINKYSDWMPNEEAAHLDPIVFSELWDEKNWPHGRKQKLIIITSMERNANYQLRGF